MHSYQAYGECLASELQLPELRGACGPVPFWTVRSGVAPPPALPDRLLGTQCIYGSCHAHLFQGPDRLSITVDDTGRYDLTAAGREITCWPLPTASPDFIRGHLLGRVLATALHFQGELVLHGSAVSFPTGAVVFLAPKHSGKSTLALALTWVGGRLISDDTIAVRLVQGAPPLVRPGIHSVRLMPHVLEEVAVEADPTERPDGKQMITGLPSERLEGETRSLAAIYLLAPAESIHGGLAVGRRLLSRPLAAAALVSQGKVTEMLGATQAPVLLERAAKVASAVPVYQLAVHHDFARLPEVVSQLGGWHGARSA